MRLVVLNLMLICGVLGRELLAKTIEFNLSPVLSEESYQAQLAKIEVRDLLQFSNGKSFRILAIPKQGDSSLIFQACETDTPDQRLALRIPLSVDKTELLEATRSSYFILMNAGVRVPRLIDSLRGQYLLQEWIEFEYSLADLLGNRNIPFRDRALLDLREFGKSTVLLSQIGDFAPKQMVYVVKEKNSEWVLLDWTGARNLVNPHPQFRDVFEGSFSSSLGRESVAIVQELRSIIARERKERAIDVTLSNSQRDRERVQSEFIENRRSRLESRGGGRDPGCRELFGRSRDF